MFSDFTISWIVQSLLSSMSCFENLFMLSYLCITFHFLLLGVIFNFHCFWSSLHLICMSVLVCLHYTDVSSAVSPSSFLILPICLSSYYYYCCCYYKTRVGGLKMLQEQFATRILEGKGATSKFTLMSMFLLVYGGEQTLTQITRWHYSRYNTSQMAVPLPLLP